jgi:1-acyl-sn-glycerol-3-phosphate acyltransferase
MLRMIWMAIYFILYLIYLAPQILKLRNLEKAENIQKHDALLHKITQAWGKRIIRQTGSKVCVTGVENIPEGPVLFVSNHQGYFDIPLLLGFVDKPKSFIAKKELGDIPVFGRWMSRIKCVFIERENVRQSLRAFQEAAKILKTGYSIVIFPEGTRSKSSEMNPFKRGSLKLGTKSGVPIVPVAIDGSYLILEANKRAIKPTEIFIKVFEPIDPKKLSKEEEAQLPDQIYNQIKNYIDSKNC